MNKADPNLDSDLTETIKSLKCVLCNYILSIPPILSISENQYQCGRCMDIKYVNTAFRNLSYEKVASYLDFPCIYPNCEALVPWKDVQNHEKDCQFKTIRCPMLHKNCQEEINLSKLTEHMVKNHGNHVFFEYVEILFPSFDPYVCVILVNSMVFLVYICCDKVIVASLKSTETSISYTLKLQNSDQNSPVITYENQPIEEFDGRKHCFRCMDNKCDLKYHPYSSSNQPKSDTNKVPSNDGGFNSFGQHNNVFGSVPGKNSSFYSGQVPLNQHSNGGIFFGANVGSSTSSSSFGTSNLFSNATSSSSTSSGIFGTRSGKEKAQTGVKICKELKLKHCTKFNLQHIYYIMGIISPIKCKIAININNEETLYKQPASYIPYNILSTIDNSEVLRKTLECPICTEYMVGSIFLCEKGHHICNNCKTLKTCPCQGIIKDARNFALESLAEHISLSCSSKENGCEFRGNLIVILEHERNCEHSGI